MHRSITSRYLSLLFTLLALLGATGSAFAQSAPVLVVGNPANPFATYYTEILRTEGFNSSDYLALASVTPAVLASRDVVILGETALTATQVSMFTTWVNGGGNLIAMRPDKQLAGLLGLTDQGTTLANGYMGVNTSQAPGLGITGATMQYHGTADRYSLNGATSIATLFSNATTATTNPIVTWRSVGASGGKAAAFTFDLARSIVYTRQGNPAWAGTERDGQQPPIIRSDDMFFGAASGDPQNDWVNRSKIAIPQADEQQRLLANMIEFLNLSRKPLPRFWYFPFDKKAAVVMTGDDHANNGTSGRFDAFNAASPAGCVVANWECIRGTSYVFPNTPIPNASTYNSQGFEIALHVNTGCADYTPANLPGFFASQLLQFQSAFPSLPAPTTNRAHCIVFSDWATQPKVSVANGIRLDTNYYYWPASWVNDTPGFMTGSGMPQRFADLDGTVIDAFQAETQMTDESGQSYPFTIDSLLDRALGADGYYGFFVANIHTDSAINQTQTWSMDIVNSAKARGVPVITSKQLLTWVDARNSSTFTNLAWSGNTLTFSLTAAANSTGLQAMLPRTAPSGNVAFINQGANAVPFTSQTIKGIQYVVFPAVTGNYTVSYSGLPSTLTVNPSSASLNPAGSQNFTATVTGLADTSVTWSMNPSFGTLTPTGPTTATYTAPASVLNATAVQITATSNVDSGLTQNVTVSIAASPAACPCSLWAPDSLPAVPADTDSAAVELGFKFRASQNGFISGIRFYKGPGNTGTHLGKLWNTTGTLLGSATFVNETASGWQQVLFNTPVPVAANTTYIASYYAPVGRYSFNANGFATAVTNGPLTALANGTDGGNGVYRYAVGGGFPNSTWNATNYWVDVVFVTSIGNTAPVATADTYTATLNTPLNVAAAGVLSNDSDSEGNPLTAIKVSDPANGTVTLNSNGSFTYTPNTGFTGTNTFTYKANDGTIDSNTVTVTITVSAPAPTAVGDSYSVSSGQPITVSAPGVLGNDVSPGGLPLTAIKLSDPANGTVTLNSNGSFTYTPNPGFAGTNTFTYRANNGTDSNTATVTISVLAVPVAANDSYSASVNTPLTVAAPGVLGNDTGLGLTAIKVSDPANGTVTLSPNGSFTYSPNTGFTGTNTFTYRVNNGLMDSNIATVTINVTTAPVATNDSYSATTAVPLTVAAPGLLGNDTGGVLTAIKVTDPANGTVTLNSNGSFTYTSNAGFTGTNTFTYRANNGSVDSNIATVTITVTGAPVAVADIYSGTSGQPLTIGAPGLLSNDTSPGGFALTAIRVANPTNGTVTVNPNGGFTYTPNSGFVGTDSFTYRANNGTADSNTVTVTLCACTVWNSLAVPANATEPTDTAPVELGMKFRANQAGYIRGIRFYKGTGNTGTHIGNLWSSTGTSLATATFTNETATGWQQVLFNTPVAVAANTTYVASYFAPVGRYAFNSNGFATAVTNGPLTALANGTDGSNGLYRYAATSGFPTSTWNATNYWVDVIFSTVP